MEGGTWDAQVDGIHGRRRDITASQLTHCDLGRFPQHLGHVGLANPTLLFKTFFFVCV